MSRKKSKRLTMADAQLAMGLVGYSHNRNQIRGAKSPVPLANPPESLKSPSPVNSPVKPIPTRPQKKSGTNSGGRSTDIFDENVEFNFHNETRIFHNIYLSRCPWCGVKPRIRQIAMGSFLVECHWPRARIELGYTKACTGPHPEPQSSPRDAVRAWNLSVKLYSE